VVLGDIDPDPEQHDGDGRQPDPQGLSRSKALRARVMSADWNSTKEALTCGIRVARPNPEATSRCLTVWMNGARLRLTVSPSTVIAPPPCPVRA
jgi:hypothetical protein